ncbi:MAG TPA: response regulator transcription factor [Acidimicrobiales bacterium]|nr:response regulator transcription factor [Acidimicrobiales bacterium]
MRPFRVVLVDDMVALRQLIRLTLERSGRFEVVGEAGNGEEGVKVAAETTPDLILLDISMPVMDGLEALPILRRTTPDATVVMLSGFSEDRLGAESAAGGAAAYLEKGLAPHVLVTRLLEVLQPTD